MKILFFSDDPDDSTIFIDLVADIRPRIDCTIITSNEDAFVPMEGSADKVVFLDYLNLPERFVKNIIKLLCGERQRENIKVVIYVSKDLLPKQIAEQLVKSGINEFVFKTSDTKALRKSIADVLNN